MIQIMSTYGSLLLRAMGQTLLLALAACCSARCWA